jgi:hypothetical protein
MLETLEENGFFVKPGPYEHLYELYTSLAEKKEPILVTADAVLHTYHVLFDFALRTLETGYLLGDLEALTDLLLDHELEGVRATKEGPIREAHHKNAAYFAVARGLLFPESEPPVEVAGLVERELDLILDAAGILHSPIFGCKEDYSQYVPRGHYTRNEDLERYFRAMMWYGRIPFYLEPDALTEGADPFLPVRQMILICTALKDLNLGDGSALEVWNRIYEPTTFFVGRTDDCNVHDVLEVLDAETLNVDLLDEGSLVEFIERMKERRGPKILSTEAWPWEAEQARSFRFMGQRFIPDSYMFQELVFDRVGTFENPRLFPRGLEVMAVLGSDRARELLFEFYDDDTIKNYEKQLDALTDEFSALTIGDWTQNLYYSWLYALKHLLIPPEGKDLPLFARSVAWPDKCLTTSLGSWAELRHDTILYAKQSYTMLGMAAPGEPTVEIIPPCYVEPYPDLFRFLAELAERTLDGLKEREILNPEIAQKLVILTDMCTRLHEIAKKEVESQIPDREDCRYLMNIGDRLESAVSFSWQFEEEFLGEADERMAIVADVHTDPNSGLVLEVGVGDPHLIFAIIPSENGIALARGGVFSYYEFKVPLSERMTDETWQDLSPKPPMEGWTRSFLVQ